MQRRLLRQADVRLACFLLATYYPLIEAVHGVRGTAKCY